MDDYSGESAEYVEPYARSECGAAENCSGDYGECQTVVADGELCVSGKAYVGSVVV